MTLSAYGFNTLMSFAGGIIGAYVLTRDPFWMMSGALGGIFSAAAGLDLYYPPLAFAIGFVGGCLIPVAFRFMEKLGIDDAVGAVSVHGFAGLWGVLACGIFASGYPNMAEGSAAISFGGQLLSGIILLLLGFIPGYAISLAMKKLGVLRVPEAAEKLGLDLYEIEHVAYPENNVPATANNGADEDDISSAVPTINQR